MKVLEAIGKRRSIRKFRGAPFSEKQIAKLVEATPLAPSGYNVQPWRFTIVKDRESKQQLCDASFNQKSVEEAPVVIVCCGDLLAWKRTKRHNQEEMKKRDIDLSRECKNALTESIDKAVSAELRERIPTTMLNVAIAIAHMVLEAVELGLGSCWVRLFDEKKIRRILGLPENLCVVALLPVGIPDEEPEARPKLSAEAMILSIKTNQKRKV